MKGSSFGFWFLLSLLCQQSIVTIISAASLNSKEANNHQSNSKRQDSEPEKLSYGDDKFSKGAYRIIKNSHICETTPGVQTYSGYIEVGKNMSMFFWFFEARNNPESAPLSLWLNGGPGCSSMIGIFQENGPCKMKPGGDSTELNPYSWNEYANMLYIDQPISAGFSYGDDDVYTTAQAVKHLWTFFQLFFDIKPFEKFKNFQVSVLSESYGGRYTPYLADHFASQNDGIRSGTLKGHLIHLSAIGINNGWFDPSIQFASYYDFAQAKFNKRFDLVDQITLQGIHDALYSEDGCLARLDRCKKSGKNQICQDADGFCASKVGRPAAADQNPYYFLHNTSDKFPSEEYLKYLAKPDVMQAIGAESKYEECADAPNIQFVKTGDDARSTLPVLAKVLNRGIRTLIWAGTDDFICNTLGGLRAIEAVQWKHQNEFIQAEWKQLTIRGETAGLYKVAGPLTYIKIFNAGHELAAYQPVYALEVFRQVIQSEPIHSIFKA